MQRQRFTVNIHDIHDTYLFESTWDREVVAGLLADETSVGSVVTPLSLNGTFTLLPSREIAFNGTAELTLGLVCVRCLNDFVLEMAFGFNYIFCPDRDGAVSQSKEVTEEEIEKTYYSGDILDLREYIGEQICLHLPDYARCKEDCRGLCQTCGTDLNQNRCQCTEQSLHRKSPFSKLEKLKKK